LPDVSKCFCGLKHQGRRRFVSLHGVVFDIFVGSGSRGCWAGSVACPAVAREQRPAYARWASAWQPSLASRAKESGLPSRSSRQRPACARRASAWQPSLASRAKASGLPSRSSRTAARLRPVGFGVAAFTRFASEGWWARQDSNLQPDRYERGESIGKR
jgi:hypothetical protein